MHHLLLQARDPDEPTRAEERASFAARLGTRVDHVHTLDLTAAPVSLAMVRDTLAATGARTLLVGGSGRYSVLDDVPWMGPFIDTLAALAEDGPPMFASCFGFQALVLGLGGEVIHDPERAEVGTFDLRLTPHALQDPLFSLLPPSFTAQLGHKDRASRLPSAATVSHLASSDRAPYQALRLEGRPVWATQFHPELTHADNLGRLLRYRREYTVAFGEDGFAAMVDSFRASPDADALLGHFAAWVRDMGDA